MRYVLGGWQLNGIFQAQTGFPLTVTQGSVLDIRYMTSAARHDLRPQRRAPDRRRSGSTPLLHALTLAQTGERPGNAGRNTVRGPGFSRTDLSLFKNFDLPRRQRVQVRVEGFNLFNQARFGQPGSVFGTSSFGQITAAEDGRIVQLAVKYSF